MVISTGLLLGDTVLHQLEFIRNGVATALTPVHWISRSPSGIVHWIDEATTTRDDMRQELESLRAKMLVLERKAQKYSAVSAENNRLRELLNASSIVDDSVLVSELVGISPDPYSHQVVINKGQMDGVQVGQAVLDAFGLFGQIVEVSEFTSRVILISDASHAVPVQVNRNGVRSIAYGQGALYELELANVPDTADIIVGDLMVTSGLGGRLPQGYPVAEVISVIHHPGRPFAEVRVRPMAHLNQSRLVLVVNKSAETRASGIER